MAAQEHSPSSTSPGCSSSCDRGCCLYHPQRKESHGKTLPQAQSQAQPVQKKALLTSDNNVCGPINEPHILRLIRIFEEWRSAMEYTGI